MSLQPTTLPLKELVKDAVSVMLLDSIRQGEIIIEPKLIAAYTGSSGSYYLIGEQLITPLMANLDVPKDVKDALGKVVWNTGGLMVLARVFGGRISFANSVMTSAGSEFMKVALDKVTDLTPSLGPA